MTSNVASTSAAVWTEHVLIVTAANKNTQPTGQPHSRTIAACIKDLRTVAATSSLLRQGLWDIGIYISRLNIGSSGAFARDWMDITKRYERILDEADRAAVQIVAILKLLYMVRESKTATLGQIVEELTVLRTELEPQVYDVKSAAVALKSDVEAFYQRAEKVAPHRCCADTGSSENSRADAKSHVIPSVNSETAGRSCRVGWLYKQLLRVLKLLLSRLRRFTRRKNMEDKARDLKPEATMNRQEAQNLGTDAELPSSSSKLVLSDNFNSRRKPSDEHIAETESLIFLESLKEVLAGIDKQTSKLDAFPQLAEQLQNTIDAYVTVMKGFGKDGDRKTVREARPRSGELSRVQNDWATVSASDVSSFGSAFAIAEQ
ncbi:hypothetical protein C8Q73DRAFT_711291 [Cubamyces lactineus]|nr:hypothetical protein C8Q73DRAFT_711291 [Cubamyces lactineus]